VKVDPELVHGAWSRQSVRLVDGPPFETQHVVWIQSGTCFADVRVPFHPDAGERCFTGRSGWDADGYRWRHHVDFEGVCPFADDVGELDWDGDTLVERGLFPTPGGTVPYEERWVRLPGWRGTFLALEGDRACLVRCGSHAITVEDRRPMGGEFAAAYRRHDQCSWTTVVSIGPADDLPTPADPPSGWDLVHRGDCS
jgi:hypothetical protein